MKLDEFYGVTAEIPDGKKALTVSLYKAFVDEDGSSTLKKIALSGESEIGVMQKLEGKRSVAITFDRGFYRYNLERVLRIWDTNTRHFGPHSNPIVGLFINRDDAFTCFNSKKLKYWDKRFWSQTTDLLKEIGTQIDQPFNLDNKLAKAVEENNLEQMFKDFNP